MTRFGAARRTALFLRAAVFVRFATFFGRFVPVVRFPAFFAIGTAPCQSSTRHSAIQSFSHCQYQDFGTSLIMRAPVPFWTLVSR
jgi:hypothetical protein